VARRNLLRTVTAYAAAFVLQMLGTGILVTGLFVVAIGAGWLESDDPGVGTVVLGLFLVVLGATVAWRLSTLVTRALVGKDITYGQLGVVVGDPPARRGRRRVRPPRLRR
jgi:hypothetical protein